MPRPLKLKMLSTAAIAALMILAGSPAAMAQQVQPLSPSSRTQKAAARAAVEGRYMFLLFYKQNDNATKAMARTLNEGLAARAGQAFLASVNANDPAEQALVAKYEVGRAPMPITLAIAPNGAVTGVFTQRITAESIEGAFVTPTMMFAMKSLQEGKLVLVSVEGTSQSPSPAAVREFCADPHFKGRLTVTSVRASDPREAKFLNRMQLNPAEKTTNTLLLAPPGVVVGKFGPSASKNDIAAALFKAGKCCDDPNCRLKK
ncbi:MAG: hypothetical protein KDA79_07550 [Planctomycetaceae bacterium]|nr:hypothetical protein [Planctomycetaceae bacterium]